MGVQVVMVIIVMIEKAGSTYWAYALNLHGLTTCADTLYELKENFEEVLEYYIEYQNENGMNYTRDDFRIDYINK